MAQKPPPQQAAPKVKPLKVEDALAYLEHVKTTFAAEPKVRALPNQPQVLHTPTAKLTDKTCLIAGRCTTTSWTS